ncbi:methyltransferase [Chloroflexi bacterium]|nr:methyltransferase [Chloroflexota bacterium]
MKLILIWLKNWIKYPLVLGAVLPTQKFASDLMASEVDGKINTVVELGAGTGQITNSILKKGIKEENLILVEINKEFSKILKDKFPKAQIYSEDVITFLENFEKRFNKRIDLIISGIPLVSLNKNIRNKLCELSVDNLSEFGKFFQITYFIRCSFPNEVIKKYNLSKKLKGFTPFNVPPAFIWKIYK